MCVYMVLTEGGTDEGGATVVTTGGGVGGRRWGHVRLHVT